MKTEFKAKFLQHVAKRKREGGFTLIELLVVIIIIGILSAIALPSFLNQANKAKQSEAKQYLSSINKGQQAFYAENGGFVGTLEEGQDDSFEKLGLGIRTETKNFTYDVASFDGGFDGEDGALAWTTEAASGLNSYGGAVFLTGADAAKTTQTILCETGEEGADFDAGTDCSQTAYTTAL